MDEADRSKERRDVPSLNDANWWQVASWDRSGQTIDEWQGPDSPTITYTGQMDLTPPDTSSLLDVLKQISDNQALLARTLTELIEELQRRG